MTLLYCRLRGEALLIPFGHLFLEGCELTASSTSMVAWSRESEPSV